MKIRALLLADDCNPDWPSLPVVGYKACRSIADHADVTVATHVRNRPQIERDGMGRGRVVYLDNEYIAAPMHKAATALRGGGSVGWSTNMAMYYPPYLAFEWEVWKRFGRELKAGKFDVVHRVTPMSPTIPSPMSQWSPVPFVLGPLNGGLKWPAAFAAELRREKEWLAYVRRVYRALPYYRPTYGHAAAILAAFGHTMRDLPRGARGKAIDFPEVGIDPALFCAAGPRKESERCTFLFAGRLVPYKCADVAVMAFAQSALLRKHKLLVVGEGPERGRLEKIVSDNGLGDCVQLLGAVPQARVGQIMREAEVFCFPSIRELGAGVVVEAMACGMCCVVVDYGGPGGLIDEKRGVKVALGDKMQLVERFGREMEKLAADPARRRRLSGVAMAYALREYSWDAKARKTVEVYEWVLGRRKDKPEFGL